MSALAGRLPAAAWRFAAKPGWSRRVGVVGVLGLILVAAFAPLIAPYSPTAQDVSTGLTPPSSEHPFGTDQLGQDVLSRVLVATRVDLQIGIIGVAIPLVLGSVIGLLAGYYRGWLDVVVGRLIDIVTAFPFFVRVLAIVAVLGPGLLNLYIAIAIGGWVAYARIVRAETLSAKRREYVLAGRALGYSDRRIMFRHLLPNVIAPTFVFAMSDLVLTILIVASVGFFGLGVQPPQAEWGAMIADGRSYITTAPWLVLFPGLAILVVGFFFSLLGDGIADSIRRVD